MRATYRDGVALSGYALLAGGTLALAEGLHRRGVARAATRKLVHIVAGLSPLYVMSMAESSWAARLPYAGTVLLNLVLWRRGALPSLVAERETPGIVWFALAQMGLVTWGGKPARRRVAWAALLSLALSDAAAALVGERWGRHRYCLAGTTRSWEGSTALALVTMLILGVLGFPRGQTLSVAGAAALVEALSPAGTDNLTVPLAVALLLQLDEG